MKYPLGKRKVTGVLVPLSALRSEKSCGCGEFADLPGLAGWCSQSGLELIQLLPVQDTGSQSSPYSALSAFGLHPIYIRITDLPEIGSLPPDASNALRAEVERLRADFDGARRFDYNALLARKMKILRSVFDQSKQELGAFVRKNGWVRAYSVFRVLKDRNNQLPWTQWREDRDPDADRIAKLYSSKPLSDDIRFYTWIQMRASEQFAAAGAAVSDLGVALKGDIPILMNEDSVDVWSEREIFLPDLRAGAPPDMFTDLGQNWDFPIYNWDALERRDYDWWKDRLTQAERYFHAYRIDHVLGFFRIWSIPAGNFTGIPGFFRPQAGFSTDDLHDAGFDDGRINWLAEPHIRGAQLRERFGDNWTTLLGSAFQQIGTEDLYTFASSVSGERHLTGLPIPEDHTAVLLEWFRDRALIRLPDGTFTQSWTFRDCSRYQTLMDHEKHAFEQLVARKGAESEEIWEAHGRRLLSFMRKSSRMLTCAEDLGVIPDSVPRTLESLDILGLRIPRWAHSWNEPGEPLIPLEEYPALTVTAPSVHDTSTVREWWLREEGKEELWELLFPGKRCPASYNPATAGKLLSGFARTNSMILVFQIQDLLALSGEYVPADPSDERVNIPGSYNDFNWTYRIPVPLERLSDDTTLQKSIRHICKARAQ